MFPFQPPTVGGWLVKVAKENIIFSCTLPNPPPPLPNLLGEGGLGQVTRRPAGLNLLPNLLLARVCQSLVVDESCLTYIYIGTKDDQTFSKF